MIPTLIPTSLNCPAAPTCPRYPNQLPTLAAYPRTLPSSLSSLPTCPLPCPLPSQPSQTRRDQPDQLNRPLTIQTNPAMPSFGTFDDRLTDPDLSADQPVNPPKFNPLPRPYPIPPTIR